MTVPQLSKYLLNYRELDRVLTEAFQQAAIGKGKERHAEENEPFEKQQICEISRRLRGNPAAGPLFQAVKKIYESGRLPTDRAVAELQGAINYIAAAILITEEDLGKVEAERPDDPASEWEPGLPFRRD